MLEEYEKQLTLLNKKLALGEISQDDFNNDFNAIYVQLRPTIIEKVKIKAKENYIPIDDEIIMESKVASALLKYDSGKGSSLISFISSSIHYAALDILKTMAPQNNKKLNSIVTEFIQEFYHEPDVFDLYDYCLEHYEEENFTFDQINRFFNPNLEQPLYSNDSDDTKSNIEEDERIKKIDSCKQLKPKEKKILKLYFDGYSNKELAEKFKCTKGYISIQLQTALAKAKLYIKF